MGYTTFTCNLIERHLNGVKTVVDLGSQNDYRNPSEKPPFISEWYKEKMVGYTCIDLAGDNKALRLNWAYPIEFAGVFDMVVDAGSSEHSAQGGDHIVVPFYDGYINSIYPKDNPTEDEIKKGYYNCWLNKHNLLKTDGIMINENPQTMSWPKHGYSYIEKLFYYGLLCLSDYQLIDVGVEAAMGNDKDGWNVFSAIKKTGNKFPSFEEFCELPIHME